MIYNNHEIRISKNQIVWEIDNKRYNLKDLDSYKEFIVNPIRQELDGTDLAQFIDESLTEEQIKNNNDYIEYPLPAHNKVLRDKKFNINTFASLMANSNKNIGDVKEMEFTNYIYESKIDEVMDFINNTCKNRMGKRTLDKHIKYILSTGYGLIGLLNTPNGLAYQLKAEIDGGYYVTIPYCQLRDLLICSNKDMLRLFIFFKDYLKNTKEGQFVTMDRSFIARSIGLSDKSTKNLDKISTMVNGLARLGYIEIKTVNERYADEEGNLSYRTVNSYRVRTVEEWETIKKQANGKK